LKDATRINNIFQFLTEINIDTPEKMIEFIEKTKKSYLEQFGNDSGMSEYLFNGLVKLESLKKTIQDVAQDYKSFRERNNGQ
jgi:hypothetical protein